MNRWRPKTLKTPAHTLPWAHWLGRRCRARREPRSSYDYWGRCELVPRHDGDHALERGRETPRWSTEWTG